MALSTYLPLPGLVQSEVIDADDAGNPAVPVFMGHGSFDPMVPFDGGRHAAEVLESLGYDVEWHGYPMAHAVCPEEIRDIAGFLKKVFSG
jgi:phospholipase/carboxylesterase